MYLTTTRLGLEYGLNAQEMNVLLKEEGFLDGEPGNYVPTEKGRKYVFVTGDDNGYGGYAHRAWDWLEWDESIKDVLHITDQRIREIREKTNEQRRRRRAEKDARSKEYWEKVNNRTHQSVSPQNTDNTNEANADRRNIESTDSTNGSQLGWVIGSTLIGIAFGLYKLYKHFSNNKN